MCETTLTNSSDDSTQYLANIMAKACIERYCSLPKTGKPTFNEWTVLSCVVQYSSDNENRNINVVSLGTGSKCIGATKMSSKGDILNDSHAEIIARRGFLLYLYENIKNACTGENSIFKESNGKFKLDQNIKFAFFSSQLPCGDAAIFPKSDGDSFGDVIEKNEPLKRNKQDDAVSKVLKTKDDTDIHRTGAKCVEGAMKDSHEPGLQYHVVRQVRTKPGRGDRTLSVSCSDKIARWIHVGIQGALINMFLEQPIFMSLFVFGNGVSYSEESLKRALLKRNNSAYCCDLEPEIVQSCVCFPNIKNDSANKPAAGSILWVNLKKPVFEVAVLGKRLGVTKKSVNKLSSQLNISKYSLYTNFIELVQLHKPFFKMYTIEGSLLEIPYNKMKKKSEEYYKKWNQVKDAFFGVWTKKGDIWDFKI